MRIAVTGSSGFIGRQLVAELARRGIEQVTFTREDLNSLPRTRKLKDCSAAIHLAAIAHQPSKSGVGIEDYLRVNETLAVDFARACAAAGVKRFVFVSTIGVISDEGGPVPLLATDTPRPTTAYAIAKARAEAALRRIEGLELAIIRPPLVYAPDAPGNLRLLARLVRVGLPLPIASVLNRRDLIGRANLVDALIHLASASALPKEAFHVKDGEPLSLAEIVRLIRVWSGVHVTDFSVPRPALELGLRLTIGAKRTRQLTGDFLIDDAELRASGWSPPHPAGHDYTSSGPLPKTPPKP